MPHLPLRDMKDSLESMIDQMDVHGLLDVLAEICYEKADHLEHEWQDRRTAKSWRESAVKLERLTVRIERHW